jgi:DNA replication protein DnaC
MIACNVGKALLKQNYDVKFVYASELIDLLMKSQGYSYITEVEAEIKKYYEADLLIIDDIFDFEKSTYWEKSSHLVIGCWDKFLRRRISENKRIVVTSNYNSASLEEKFGVSIFNLIQRNFYELTFYDNVNEVRKSRFDNLFD